MNQLKIVKLNSGGKTVTETMILHSLLASDLIKHFSITDLPEGMIGVAAELPAATVVFDLADSSLSIRKNGAKEYAADSQDLFRSLSNIIYGSNGIIEKFPGDGISMHFPAVSMSMNKAVLRAYDAIKTMDHYLQDKKGMLKSQYRFTLTYGKDTIVTKFGNERHTELISIGHAVNVAHKLEKLVKDGGYYIGMDHLCKYIIEKEGAKESFEFNMMPTDLRREDTNDESWWGVRY
ncbi:hypothetical protein [Planococcus salinus]|uniref:Adenylate/guanylate cyclase domain-containing protein n=1 Tax=Planococcus salinus TaxID=1848460 RepID=A0A3M8P5B7_9BACL|nr:hypothetical protein [Planococcus salinus]RNF38873.1 hypothetical protein EEX84_12195 [Planococcus salinus]